MTNDELQERADRLDKIHKGFCEDARRFRMSENPDEVIYSLKLEQAAWEVAQASAALERVRVRGGLRVRT